MNKEGHVRESLILAWWDLMLNRSWIRMNASYKVGTG
jgi:hypothetical protein